MERLKEREEHLAAMVPQIQRDAQAARRLQEVLEQEEKERQQQELEDLALAKKLQEEERNK